MLTPEKHEEMYESIKRVEKGLFGDKEAGIEGIVNRVKANEKYIEKDKKLKWTGIGVAAAGGFLVKFWDKIFG